MCRTWDTQTSQSGLERLEKPQNGGWIHRVAVVGVLYRFRALPAFKLALRLAESAVPLPRLLDPKPDEISNPVPCARDQVKKPVEDPLGQNRLARPVESLAHVSLLFLVSDDTTSDVCRSPLGCPCCRTVRRRGDSGRADGRQPLPGVTGNL